MPLRIEQLEGRLQRGLSPVYLFAGPEPMLVQECRDRVRAAAAEQGYSERELLEVDRSFDWDRLAEIAATPSLFATKRILDLRLPTGKPGQAGARALVAWAEAPDPDTLLIVTCEQWDANSRRAKWAKAVERAGTRVDIWTVKAQEMPGLVGQRMQAAGLQPDREAVMVLAERLQGNLLAVQQEIEKLVLLKGTGPVSGDDVLSAVADSARFDAFLLVERVLEGNLADALRVALGLQRTGVAIQMVTGALVRALETLEAYRSAMAAGENEASVFRRHNVWHSRQAALRDAARRIHGARLADAWSRLTEVDLQSKGRAGGDPWLSLDQLICRLCA